MDEIKNCKMCGRIFQANAFSYVCQNCITHDEEDFNRIREYLYEHPLASIYEVATNLDVTINKIKHYLREGRIEIVEKTNQFLGCEICGKPIRSGRYCDDCFKQTKHEPKPASMGNNTSKPDSKLNNDNFNKVKTEINYLSKNKGHK